MKKYLWGFLFFFVVSVLVSSQYEKYAHDSATPSEDNSSSTVNPSTPQKAPGDAQKSQDYPPRWLRVSYQLFGWPNGITVWALFLTLMTIAEQTKQTAKAAKATEDSVKVSHDGLRAWLEIDVRENEIPTTLTVNMFDQINSLLTPSPQRFVWRMKNCGQTPAFIQKIGSGHTYANVATLDTMATPVMHPIITFIGAGREQENPITIEMGVLREVVTQLKFWRIAIKVEYLDAFDKTQIHETMVSFHYYVPRGEKDPVKRGFYQEIDPTTNYNT